MKTSSKLVSPDTMQEVREDLADYLIKLSLDPVQAETFRKDPTSAMTAENLSESDQALILSGQPRDIYNALGKDGYIEGAVIVVAAAVVVVNASQCNTE